MLTVKTALRGKRPHDWSLRRDLLRQLVLVTGSITLSFNMFKAGLLYPSHSWIIGSTFMYSTFSSPSLIRTPYLPRNCGHIRKVICEGDVNVFIEFDRNSVKIFWPH